MGNQDIDENLGKTVKKAAHFFENIDNFLNGKIHTASLAAAMHICISSELLPFFIALIHPIQWTIANPVGADRPAKRQKKTSCVATGWPVRSTVHSPDGASYFLPV